jgi:hypothetical protein
LAEQVKVLFLIPRRVFSDRRPADRESVFFLALTGGYLQETRKSLAWQVALNPFYLFGYLIGCAITAGRSANNAFAKSFNGTRFAESLNPHLFMPLTEA